MDKFQQPSASDEVTSPSLFAEMQRLRRAVLRHGHAQDQFQTWFAAQVDRLASLNATGEAKPPRAEPSETAGSVSQHRERPPSQAQLRVFLELDQAVLHLIRLTLDPKVSGADDEPRTLREGLDFLKIRVRNLQRSFGLEPIATVDRPFDDRLHAASSVEHRKDRPDGHILEEILPGYRLNDQILRPALVIVNQHPKRPLTDQPETERGNL